VNGFIASFFYAEEEKRKVTPQTIGGGERAADL